MTTITPGTLIGPATNNIIIGNGVYVRGGQLYASLLGELNKTSTSVSVKSKFHSLITPRIASTIIGKVLKINPRFATVQIMVVDDEPIGREVEYSGIIQQKDVRQTNVDAVKIYESFRPGDVVRYHLSLIDPSAHVISLGEQKNFILSKLTTVPDVSQATLNIYSTS
jgi:exosome complex component CSL4